MNWKGNRLFIVPFNEHTACQTVSSALRTHGLAWQPMSASDYRVQTNTPFQRASMTSEVTSEKQIRFSSCVDGVSWQTMGECVPCKRVGDADYACNIKARISWIFHSAPGGCKDKQVVGAALGLMCVCVCVTERHADLVMHRNALTVTPPLALNRQISPICHRDGLNQSSHSASINSRCSFDCCSRFGSFSVKAGALKQTGVCRQKFRIHYLCGLCCMCTITEF